MARGALAGLLVCLACVWSPGARAEEPRSELRLIVEAPHSGARLGPADRRLFITGRAFHAQAHDSARRELFDVVLVIDTSASTRAPSGADVDGDGHLGHVRFGRALPFLERLFTLAGTDPGDSILAAEIAAARALLTQLDPGTTRVGVVSFAGDSHFDTPDARTMVSPTSRFPDVHGALDELLADGPSGLTNFPRAVELASDELESSARPDAERIVLFMTDGQATLPDVNDRQSNGARAIEAVERVQEIRFDTFAIGETANRDPDVLAEMAHVSGGQFTAVDHPADLVATFEGIRLAPVQRLRIRNKTTRGVAEYVHLSADGVFSGLIELTEGTNVIEVRARSADDLEDIETLEVTLLDDVGSRPWTSHALQRRARMLESRLAEERGRRQRLEETHRDQQLRQLEQEIEAVRAELRAREREKRLRVETDDAESAGSR